jgi:SAM-dependent methyltransferase
MSVFGAYADYYDLLYEEKGYEQEAEFVLAQLARAMGGPIASVLDLGCGSGGHMQQFIRAGVRTEGVDLSFTMLQRARRRLGSVAGPDASSRSAALHEGDVRDVRLGRTFDAVVALFHVMSYVTSGRDMKAALQTARAHLQPGGLFLFDFWYGPGVLTDPPAVRVKRIVRDGREIVRIAEPTLRSTDNVVEVRYELLDKGRVASSTEPIHEVHTMRYWFWPELQELLTACGFEPVSIRRWMSDEQPDPGAWYAFAVARAT